MSRQYTTCDANASFSSQTSMSSTRRPCRFSSLGTAKTGPMPISSGSHPAMAYPRNTSKGSMPSAFARAPDMTSVADAPSDSCDEFPAVTLPWPLAVSNTGGSLREALQGRVGTIALVAIDVRLLFANSFAALLVQHGAPHLHRRDLGGEEPFPLGARRPLLTGERVFILRFAADAVALRHDLRGVAHRHVDARKVLLHPRVRRAVALQHRDRFDAAANRDVDAFLQHHVSGLGHGLQSGIAEAIHGDRSRGDRAGRPEATRYAATLLPAGPCG